MQKQKSSREEWSELIAEYQAVAGQESQESFARRKRLRVSTFRYWLYKWRSEQRAASSIRFIEVKTEAPSRGDQDAGLMTKASAGDRSGVVMDAGVEVELSAGRCRLRFGGDVTARRIGEVVAALSERLPC